MWWICIHRKANRKIYLHLKQAPPRQEITALTAERDDETINADESRLFTFFSGLEFDFTSIKLCVTLNIFFIPYSNWHFILEWGITAYDTVYNPSERDPKSGRYHLVIESQRSKLNKNALNDEYFNYKFKLICIDIR